MYPAKAQLSPSERSDVCYLSFPDSNSGYARDTTYHFRVRRSEDSPAEVPMPTSSTDIPPALEPSETCFYGFVHFRQQKNPDLPRGYYQKVYQLAKQSLRNIAKLQSVVLLTVHPFFALFHQVIDLIALAYFDTGEMAIETACHHIDHWNRPTPGASARLPLLGRTLVCRVPCRADAPHKLFFPDAQVVVFVEKPELVILAKRSFASRSVHYSSGGPRGRLLQV